MQRLGRGLLLGALLARAEAVPEHLAVDDGLDLELAVVRRPAEAQDSVDDRLGRARQMLLQLGLVVDVAALSVHDVLFEDLDDRGPHGLEAEGHVDRPDQRLGEVGEDVLVGLELREVAGVGARPGVGLQHLPRPSRAATRAQVARLTM